MEKYHYSESVNHKLFNYSIFRESVIPDMVFEYYILSHLCFIAIFFIDTQTELHSKLTIVKHILAQNTSQ